MGSHLLHIFTFLSLVVVASHAILPSEVYWKSILPNTPMPKAVRDLLPLGKGGVSIGHMGKEVKLQPTSKSYSFIIYKYAATKELLHDNPNAAFLFLKKDMHQGTQKNLHFTKSTNATTFLPRQVAESIPFSSSKLPEILNHFLVKPNSMEAKVMEQTINECEEPGIKGEDKYCATSLESMIDFTTSKLGKKVLAISTEVQKETQLQRYTILGVEKIASHKSVICHKENYAYVVFYCHKTDNIKAYTISLVSADRTKVKAVAVCHTNTSAWNPNHVAFQVLKVKPGAVPICHFLPEGHIVWVRY